MSLPKAQLVDPQGNMNLPGMTATGIVTASSLKGVTTGSATGLTGNPDLDVGIVTASSFVGQGDGHAANLTGTPELNLGITTSTGFVGDATGKAAGLTGTPNLNVGLITATSFVGFVTGDVTGNITGDVTGNITGNIQGDVEGDVTGDVSGLARGLGINGTNVWTGAGTSNLGVGVCTALEYYGDGSTLTGAGSTAYIAQEITATGYAGDTIIDLTYGNLIYYKGEAATTVGFASTAAAEQITFIRDAAPVTYDIDMDTAGVDFDSGEYLTQTTDAVLRNWMDQAFTVEYWIKADSLASTDGGSGNSLGASTLGSNSNFTWSFGPNSLGQVRFGYYTGSSETAILPTQTISTGTWYHLAFVHDGSNNCKIFIDGVLGKEATISNGTADGGTLNIGKVQTANFDGKISNLRITHQALYSNDFIPPTEALTTTSQGAVASNVKLLCCQSSTDDTAATVTPSTITANGTPTPNAETITQSGSITATISWPARIKWKDGVTPTLLTASYSKARQIFRLTTADTGLTYTGWEEIEYNPARFKLFTWGDNGKGTLGLNNITDFSSPVQVGSSEEWSSLGVSGTNALGTKGDGTLWSWGINNSGMLGLNNTASRSSPTQIPGTTWSKAFQGGEYNAALKTNGTLWTWGMNETGQLGLNQPTGTKYSSPIQLGTSTDWASYFGGNNYVMATKTDGTLWMWGDNNDGKLGQNDLTKRSSPTQVPGTTWSTTKGKLSLGNHTSFCIKTDGTLWAWGESASGCMGNNTQGAPAKRSSPLQIGTDTTWFNITSGAYNSIATKTDGTLWSWGYNIMGELGHNNRTKRSSPTQIPGTTWHKVAAFYQAYRATKTDGTLWAWGANHDGILGQNEGGQPGPRYSSPVQIPGTSWKLDEITTGRYTRGFTFQ